MMVMGILLSVIGAEIGEAAFNLSVSPIRGGNALRFGRIDTSIGISEEVRVRISSSQNQQYQVFQSIVNPLVNEKGEFLHPAAFKSYSISGSNSSGTLYFQQIDNIRQADQLIYTSSRTGESDMFTMAYTLDLSQVNASGRFHGKILYTLRSISGAAPQQVFLDVFLDIAEELSIQTRASSGRDTVRIDSRNPSGYFHISFSGNLADEINIYQDIQQVPTDEAGLEIMRDLLEVFVAADDERAIRQPHLMPFGRKTLVYSSRKPEDEFVVYFDLNQEILNKQKAGVYKGVINYIFQKKGFTRTVSLSIIIEIDPVFQIIVSFPDGDPSFGSILPNHPPKIKQAVVEVRTNLNRPYSVNQNVVSSLANEKGDIFKKEFFDMKVEAEGCSARVRFDEFQSVPSDERAIFYSNAKGDPCTINIFYRLRPYLGMAPGDYAASIVFSLGEI